MKPAEAVRLHDLAEDIEGASSIGPWPPMPHGGAADGLVVTFTEERQYMTMQPYDPGNIQQYIIVTAQDEPWVILNNHNESNAMDRSMYLNDQGFIIAFPWNCGPNQIRKKHYCS